MYLNGNLPLDISGKPINGFVPDPDKSQVPITGTKTFKKDGTGDVAISGWMCVAVKTDADASYYYNSDNTKTMTIDAGVETILFVGQGNVESLTLVLGTATASIQGM